MTPLTNREIRNLYKNETESPNLLSMVEVERYIVWLETLLAKSNFNTVEGIEQVVSFKETCHLCEQPTYSSKHQICKNPECFNFVLKDPK